MAYGVTADGFVVKPLDVIITEMEDRARTVFGSDVDLTETSVLKKYIEVIAMEEARLWETSEMYYYAGYVDSSTGIQLDRVTAILGVIRVPAGFATGVVTFSGTPGTNIPAGTPVVAEDGTVFVTDSLVIISGGGTVDADITAQIAGTTGNVSPNTITALQSFITGVSSVNNAAGTSGGTDAEADDELRARAKAYLETKGKGTLEAIENAILEVASVETVKCYEDLSIHDVVCYVTGATPPNSDVDDAIEDTRPAGIPVSWQNPTPIDIYVDATVTVNPATAPADAATQVENGILGYINSLDTGDDVIYTKVIDAIYDVEENETSSWIEDVDVKTGTTPSPTGTVNIVIANDEKAQSDSGKVGVTIV